MKLDKKVLLNILYFSLGIFSFFSAFYVITHQSKTEDYIFTAYNSLYFVLLIILGIGYSLLGLKIIKFNKISNISTIISIFLLFLYLSTFMFSVSENINSDASMSNYGIFLLPLLLIFSFTYGFWILGDYLFPLLLVISTYLLFISIIVGLFRKIYKKNNDTENYIKTSYNKNHIFKWMILLFWISSMMLLTWIFTLYYQNIDLDDYYHSEVNI